MKIKYENSLDFSIDQASITITGTPAEVGRVWEAFNALFGAAVVTAAAALSVTDLSMMPTGAVVQAGGFADEHRHDRVAWRRIGSGRWSTGTGESVDGNPGVSSLWLASNRRPTELEAAP